MLQNAESLAPLLALLPLVLMAALFLWLRLRRRRLVAELSDLASARGWRCEQVHGLFGQSARVAFTPQDGSGWSLQVKTRRATRHSAATGHTEFHTPSPVFAGGFALFTGGGGGAELAGAAQELASRMRSAASLSKATPLAANNSSSSPESVISVMISQPPTNSPLT